MIRVLPTLQVSVWVSLAARVDILTGRSQHTLVLVLTKYLLIPTLDHIWDGVSISSEGNKYAGDSSC